MLTEPALRTAGAAQAWRRPGKTPSGSAPSLSDEGHHKLAGTHGHSTMSCTRWWCSCPSAALMARWTPGEGTCRTTLPAWPQPHEAPGPPMPFHPVLPGCEPNVRHAPKHPLDDPFRPLRVHSATIPERGQQAPLRVAPGDPDKGAAGDSKPRESPGHNGQGQQDSGSRATH